MTSVNEFDQDDLAKPELDGAGLEKPDPEKVFDIQIDRVTYQVSQTRMTGADLRRVLAPRYRPIGISSKSFPVALTVRWRTTTGY